MLGTEVEIRFSKAEDFPALAELDNVTWVKGTTPSDSIHWLSSVEYGERHPAGSQLVASVDNVTCGYIYFNAPTPLPSNRHVAELVMAVHPGFHGKGIGQKLMEGLEKWAREIGKTKLCLRVMASNEKAQSFYRKCGFQEQGRLVKEFYMNGEYVDDLLMYKFL